MQEQIHQQIQEQIMQEQENQLPVGELEQPEQIGQVIE